MSKSLFKNISTNTSKKKEKKNISTKLPTDKANIKKSKHGSARAPQYLPPKISVESKCRVRFPVDAGN